MVDIPALREEVKILAEKAVNADKCKDYENAFQYYSKAAKKLNYIKKSDDNIYIKDICRKREFEYINRAKYIKEALEKGKGKDKKGDNCEGDDNEINENIIVNKIKNFNEIIDVNILERDSKILLKTFSEKDLNKNKSNELIKKDDNNDNTNLKIKEKKINIPEINLKFPIPDFNCDNKEINEDLKENKSNELIKKVDNNDNINTKIKEKKINVPEIDVKFFPIPDFNCDNKEINEDRHKIFSKKNKTLKKKQKEKNIGQSYIDVKVPRINMKKPKVDVDLGYNKSLVIPEKNAINLNEIDLATNINMNLYKKSTLKRDISNNFEKIVNNSNRYKINSQLLSNNQIKKVENAYNDYSNLKHKNFENRTFNSFEFFHTKEKYHKRMNQILYSDVEYMDCFREIEKDQMTYLTIHVSLSLDF